MKFFNATLVSMFLSICVMSNSQAVEPSDNGIWSSDQTALQGFNFVYAPTAIPSIVAYWYTYDEDGNQAWFISDNIPVNSSQSEDTVSVFKPMCSFVDDAAECSIGDAVGILAIGRSGNRISVRFGISTSLEGFSEKCAGNLTIEPQVSPLPPAIPSEYACQSRLVLHRVSPEILELTK